MRNGKCRLNWALSLICNPINRQKEKPHHIRRIWILQLVMSKIASQGWVHSLCGEALFAGQSPLHLLVLDESCGIYTLNQVHRIQSSGRFHTLSFSGNPDDLLAVLTCYNKQSEILAHGHWTKRSWKTRISVLQMAHHMSCPACHADIPQNLISPCAVQSGFIRQSPQVIISNVFPFATYWSRVFSKACCADSEVIGRRKMPFLCYFIEHFPWSSWLPIFTLKTALLNASYTWFSSFVVVFDLTKHLTAMYTVLRVKKNRKHM